jgi:hypothetical protein
VDEWPDECYTAIPIFFSCPVHSFLMTRKDPISCPGSDRAGMDLLKYVVESYLRRWKNWGDSR